MSKRLPVIWNHNHAAVIGYVEFPTGLPLGPPEWDRLELSYEIQGTADGDHEVVTISIGPKLSLPAVEGKPQDDRPERFLLERPCPKCGCGPSPSVACDQHHPLFKVSSTIPMSDHHDYVPEDHLHRRCIHCGHDRIELALDAPYLSVEERHAAIEELRTRWAVTRETHLANWASVRR